MDTSFSLAQARDLVAHADAEPAAVCSTAENLLRTSRLDAVDRAIVRWAFGLALRHLRQLDAAEAQLLAAIADLAAGSDDHTGATLSLAGTLALQGRFDDAERALAGCVPSAALAGRVTYQRAAFAERLGRLDDASAGYEKATQQFEEVGDELGLAHAAAGHGLVLVAKGEHARAIGELGRAHALYRDQGLAMLAAVVQNNLGWAAARAGDHVSALRLLSEAAESLEEHGDVYSETALDHVDTLLALGLPAEAAARAADVLPKLEASRLELDRADLLVGLGRALHESGSADLATNALDVAERAFTAVDHQTGLGRVLLRRAEFARTRSTHELAIVEELFERFTRHEELVLALDAAALAGDIAADLDDLAALDRNTQRARRLSPTDTRCFRLRAQLAHRQTGHRTAAELAIEGLRRAERERSGLLTADVRAGAAQARARLLDVGLDAALDAGDAETGFAVAAAALSARDAHRVARSLPDDIVAALRSDPSSTDWRRLAMKVRTGATATIQPPIHQIELAEMVGRTVVLTEAGDRGVGIEVVDGAAMFLPTIDLSEFTRLVRRYRLLFFEAMFDARTAESLDRAARAIADRASWLDDDRPVTIVCTGRLTTVPWASLARGPVRVAPDLGVRSRSWHGSSATVAAGPDLASGEEETAVVSEVWGCKPLTGDDASAEAVLDSRADVLHLACHGSHHPTNGLLSAYVLAGGRLTGFEIERADATPDLVVAAACRSGESHASSGSEAVGLPTAWLYAGTQAVIAPVCEIPDDNRTVAVMAELHSQLRAGAAPEHAIVELRRRQPGPIALALQVTSRRPQAGDD